MFHLKAGVHFQEVKAAILVHQKLDRAGVVIAGGARRADGGFAHGMAHFEVLLDKRRGTFLGDFLVAALDGAFAFAQVNHVAVLVAHELNFDVAGMLDEFFDVDLGVTERALGFARSIPESGLQIGVAIHAAHALAAATRDGLQENGIAVGGGKLAGLVERDAVIGAGHDGGAGGDGGLARGGLRSHHADGMGRGADENDAGIFAGGSEIGIFAEESVARMNGLGAVFAGGVEDAVHTEIAIARERWANVLGLIGHAHLFGGAVGVRVDRHRS